MSSDWHLRQYYTHGHRRHKVAEVVGVQMSILDRTSTNFYLNTVALQASSCDV